MIKVFLFGFDGKMGKTLRDMEAENIQIVGGLDTKGVHILNEKKSPFEFLFDWGKNLDINRFFDSQKVCNIPKQDNSKEMPNAFEKQVPFATSKAQEYITRPTAELKKVLEKLDFDVIVDFSNHTLGTTVLESAYYFEKPLLLASTGHAKRDLQILKKYAKTIPIMVAPNLSIGIATLIELCKHTQRHLQNSDIEMLDIHHNKKLDKPSGTAKLIKSSIVGHQVNRKIKVHSIRAGNAVGIHEVSFFAGDEILSIRHTTQNRTVYAKGAIKAIEFLYQQKSGLFEMRDCLGCNE